MWRGEARPSSKPNILWMIAEDFCPDLGCYGNTSVKSPRIDKLATEGVLYTQACVTAPICSIARSALLTGMYQTAIGAHNHRSHRDDDYHLPAGVTPFPDLFRQAGYHTSNLKKSPVGGTARRTSTSTWTSRPTTVTIGPSAPRGSRSTPRSTFRRRIEPSNRIRRRRSIRLALRFLPTTRTIR
ncbi:MAG: sulfatase-like hydrolase/transferase [Bryobacterales bacterium]